MSVVTRTIQQQNADFELQRAQAAFGAARTPEEREAARAAGQAARAAGATDAGAQAAWTNLAAIPVTASPAITPQQAAGFDPNWFMNLSVDAQERANFQRQQLGLPRLATDRPLTYQESMAAGFPVLPQQQQPGTAQPGTAQPVALQQAGAQQAQPAFGDILKALQGFLAGNTGAQEAAAAERERLWNAIDALGHGAPAGRTPMSWEEALARAQQMVNPEADLARYKLLEDMSRQFEVLPYELAGRGQLHGGLAEGGWEGLTQARARGLSELEMRRQAASLELADSIRRGDEASVAAELDRAFREWSVRFEAAVAQQGQMTEMQYRNAQLEFQRGVQAFDMAWRMMTYPNEVTRNAINDAADVFGGFLNIIASPVNIEAFVDMISQMA